MLQQDYLLEWRTILKNVLLGLEIRRELSPESIRYAHRLLSQYGLEKFESARPHELSGGMRQRAALVRTLVLKPELLLLDEPFSALDYQTRLTAGNDIGGIIKEQKKTAILVTHDLSEAVSLADRILILSSRPARLRRIVSIDMPAGTFPYAAAWARHLQRLFQSSSGRNCILKTKQTEIGQANLTNRSCFFRHSSGTNTKSVCCGS